jgi:hypothetical protein
MKPARSILDPAFRYTPSASTDLRKLFARIKRERAQEAERQRAAEEEAASVVRTLPILRTPRKAAP